MKNLIYFIIVLMVGMGCSDDDEKGTLIPTTDFKLDKSNCSWKWESGSLNPVDQQYILLINEEGELKDCLTCDDINIDMEDIDFTTQSLLVVYGQATNGIVKIDKKLYQTAQIYQLTVDILLNGTEIAPIWTEAIITPKIAKVENVKFVVSYKQN